MTASSSSLLSSAGKSLVLAAGLCAMAFPAAAQFGEAKVIQAAPAPPAAAPPAPADASRPATPLSSVTVQAATPAAVKQLSRTFVQTLALRSGKIDQLPRWHQPVCVAVRGLVADKANHVAARVEEVARAVGLKVEKPGCGSNIQIMFTDQPQKLADGIGEPYLGYHNQNENQKIRMVTHPIQGWYATATAGAAGATGLAFAGGSGTQGPGTTNGMNLAHGADSTDSATSNWEANFGQANGVQLSMNVVDSPLTSAPTGCADSRFSSCMKSMFMNVIIVVDAKAVEGKDMRAVTDYVAMLAVSQPRSLDGCNPLPSVLDLLAKTACTDRDAPIGMTAADSAYLAGLYASDAEARTVSAESDIANHMAAILIKAQTASR